MPDPIKQFYEDVKKSGAVQNLPDFDSFRSALSDPANRRTFYNEINSSGMISNLPDYEKFNTTLFDEKTGDSDSKSSLESDLTREQQGRNNILSEIPESSQNEDMGVTGDMGEPEPQTPEKNKSFSQIPKTFWNTASKQVIGMLEGMKAALHSQPRTRRGQPLDPTKTEEEYEQEDLEIRKQAFRNSMETMEEFQESQEGSITTTDDIGDWVDGLNYVGNAIAQSAAQIPLSLLSRGGTSIGQEIGIIYTDQVQKIAEQEGIEPEQVIEQGLDDRGAALAWGVAAGALDYLGAKKATQAVPFKDIKRSLGQRFIGMFNAAKVEGGTEGAQSIIEQFGSAFSSGSSFLESILGINPKEVGEEALVGLIGGTGVNVGSQTVQVAQQVRKKAQQSDKGLPEGWALRENPADVRSLELFQPQEQQQEQQQEQDTEVAINPFGNIERNQVDNPFTNKTVAASDATMVDGVDGAISTSQTAQDTKANGTQNLEESVRKDNQGFTGSEEIVQRKEDAFGIRSESVFKRAVEKARDIKKSFTQRYTNLDKEQDAVGIDILRQYEALDSYAEVSAHNSIANIVSELNDQQYKTFVDALALPDIVKDVENGLYQGRDELPFGYENVEQVQEDITRTKEEIKNNPEIQKAIEKRQKFVGDLKQRMVQYDLLPEKVLDDNRYFHRQVTKYFNNQEYKGTGISSYDVRVGQKGFQKKREGGTDFNTAYHESEFEWVSQALKQIGTVETLNRLNSQYNIKDQLQQEASVLSESQGQTVDWRDLIPEDHTIWSPEKGNHFYQAHSIEDRVVDDILSGRKEFEESDIRNILAVAKKDNWVVPDRVSETLNDFQTPPDQGPIAKVARNINTSWKQWTLINPLRIIKYNLNNTSGDADIAFAYDPGVLKHVKQSAKDLYQNHKGRASLDVQQEMEELTRLGVIESGLTVQEIPDLTKEGVFGGLVPNKRGKIKKAIDTYWNASKDYTNMRENVLRVAAFRRFKNRLEAGEENVYGASKPEQIDQIEDTNEKAAKLARELIGDYGGISEAGQWLRKNMIPFYSWMEINAPRYYRMIKNLPKEGKSATGRGAGLVAKKVAGTAVKGGIFALKASALFSLMTLWNKSFFPDEEEDLINQRNQMQLILGRREDGSVRSIRFEGALADALEWFGLEDAPSKVQNIQEGEQDVGEVLSEMAQAPLNRIVNGSVPIPKTIAESLMGATLYPDVFEPRPIRDPGEHASRLFSLDYLYNFITNKPTPPGGPVEKLFMYRTNPDEAAYYHTKRLVIDYLKEQGRSFPRIVPTERQNALYYYKQAAKWGQRDKAKFWFDKYKELGGSQKGLKRSIQASEPLGALSKKDRIRFLKSLDKEEIDVVKRSQKWYDSVYK